MSTSWRSDDPDAGLEASKYDNPVPSRTLILQHLEKRGAPAHYELLVQEFGIDDADEQEGLRRRLIAMVRDGQLIQTRKGAFGPLDKMDLIVGTVQGHRDGFGFVIPKEGGDDLFLTARQMKELFDGDRVVVRETDVDNRGRRYCALVDIIERSVTQVVGPYHEEDGLGFVVPEGRRMTNEVVIEPGALTPTPGQIVLVDIKEYPTRRHMAIGVIREILGDRMDAGMEIDIALRSHEIPFEWPEAVKKATKSFKPEVAEKDKQHRIDMRAVPFVTIDGEDARDFDDAVYAEKKRGGGWRLFVAIADVSHYVKPGSALDDEAVNRGNSVYFPGYVVPMLPEVLSNGLCSLNPHVDRLAMICEMTISAKGKMSGYKFYEGVICSHARLTYTKVGKMLQEAETEEGAALRAEYADVVKHVDTLYDLYHVLRSVRDERGAIDFETTETRIVFDRNRKIEKIVPVVRNDAHKLIEECMLCANVATAKFLEKHELPALYRVHEGPTDKKLESLKSFLGELGLSLPGRNQPTPKDYQQLLNSIAERGDAHVIQVMLLRSLSQAVYDPENNGHFGLAYSAYAHFTSPIRRYPDLLVHRAIRYVIRSERETKHVERAEGAKPLKKNAIFPYDFEQMIQLGEQCSMTERRADDATRDVTDWLKCEYIQNHIGDVFEGVISTVTGFGLFVELTDIFVTGLVHISALPGDYYHYDSAQQRLVGERTAMSFRLGDPVTVQVVRVDLDEKNIDFELANAPSASRKGRRKTAKDRDGFAKDKARERAQSRRATGRKPKPNAPVEPTTADSSYRMRLLEERGRKDDEVWESRPPSRKGRKGATSSQEEGSKGRKKSKVRKDKGKRSSGKKKAAGKTGQVKASQAKESGVKSTRKKPSGAKPSTSKASIGKASTGKSSNNKKSSSTANKPARTPRKRPAKKS
ncbi:ribonuclease R [Parendozoicomonas haliclonae]|uniref:Ribonuclease R n=1 Tax=Parendozoicomonas haliclonae TaxID=1960125 RepID=A0A1X7AL81_9GAMM|nr:ribonuclease R [Parendozoicomonas haliclonae]SMA48223.1 Ribonuclease R [Parendozoicomonas haliclonae]